MTALLIGLVFAAPALADRLPVRIYTSADGLGSSFIDWIYRDSRGFMWFCTRDGLSRFDGKRFINYRIGEPNAAPGVEVISETSDGWYWVSTTGGTLRFDPNQPVAADSASPALNAEFVTPARGAVFEDSTGRIWMATSKILNVVFENGKPKTVEADLGLPPRPDLTFVAFQMAESADGSVWFDTSWGIIRRLPDGRVVYYRDFDFVLNGSGAVSMTLDKSQRVWVTRRNSVLIIDPEPIESLPAGQRVIVRDLTPGGRVTVRTGNPGTVGTTPGTITEFQNLDIEWIGNSLRVYAGGDGTLWITTGGGLMELTAANVRFHSSDEGLPGAMSRVGEDSDGNLWIGGHAGAARLDRRGLISFGSADGAPSSRFFAITEDNSGTVYFANSDSYIVKNDGDRLVSVRPDIEKNPLHAWTSRFVFLDSRGDWWFLSNNGAYRFSGVRRFEDLNGRRPTKAYGVPEGLKSEVAFQIFEDSRGAIWLSTRGRTSSDHGLSVLRPGETRFSTFSKADGLPDEKTASSFAESADGTIWMTIHEGGVMRYRDNRFEVFGEESGIPNGLVSDLMFDEKGRLWITSTVGGVIRVDDPAADRLSVSRITTENGLASNNVRTVTRDRLGRIYFGSARGVDRLDPDTGSIRHYSVNDGLAADFVVDSHLDRHGNVWFATNNGVSRLVPKQEEEVRLPNALIGSLRISGIEQPISQLGAVKVDRGELGHNDNNLQIEFFALNFRPGETVRYQYLLEGAGGGWSAPSENTTVTLVNLSPANYRFLVRTVNSEGIAGEGVAVVSFRILPPVWARWWFIALATLAVVLVVVFLFRYRLKKLREVNQALEEARSAEERLRRSREDRLAELEQVRSRIATDLHDDIGASLTQIAILSEIAQAQTKNGATEPLRAISKVSNELVGTMSDIVWSINPTKDHFSDLTQRMRRFASDLFTTRDIVLNFQASHSDDALTVNSNIRREVFLIFKEAVNNIVKHAGATRVEIIVGVETDNLIVSIADDGHGFDCDGPAGPGDDGNGIASMRKRAAEMRGTFEITSAGGGTRIRFVIPFESAQRGGAPALPGS